MSITSLSAMLPTSPTTESPGMSGPVPAQQNLLQAGGPRTEAIEMTFPLYTE